MIIDKIKAIIVILISCLIAWGCYEISSDNVNQSVAIVVVMIIALSTSGVLGLASKIEDERQSMLVKTTSVVMYILFVLLGLVFSFFEFNVPFYVILNIVLLLIYALVVLRLNKVDY